MFSKVVDILYLETTEEGVPGWLRPDFKRNLMLHFCGSQAPDGNFSSCHCILCVQIHMEAYPIFTLFQG